MALIKACDPSARSGTAVVLDLGDLSRQAEALRQRARAEAERIVREAREERERILKGAVEEGRAAGFERGLEEGRERGAAEGREQAAAEMAERLRGIEQGWSRALEEFERGRGAMLLEARQAIVSLAALVASRVSRRVVELDAETVARELESAIALVAAPTRLRVRVHPDDREIVSRHLPGLASRLAGAEHVEIEEDASLTRGGCVVRTAGGGEIDATIETQVGRLVSLLVPEVAA